MNKRISFYYKVIIFNLLIIQNSFAVHQSHFSAELSLGENVNAGDNNHTCLPNSIPQEIEEDRAVNKNIEELAFQGILPTPLIKIRRVDEENQNSSDRVIVENVSLFRKIIQFFKCPCFSSIDTNIPIVEYNGISINRNSLTTSSLSSDSKEFSSDSSLGSDRSIKESQLSFNILDKLINIIDVFPSGYNIDALVRETYLEHKNELISTYNLTVGNSLSIIERQIILNSMFNLNSFANKKLLRFICKKNLDEKIYSDYKEIILSWIKIFYSDIGIKILEKNNDSEWMYVIEGQVLDDFDKLICKVIIDKDALRGEEVIRK